MTKRNSVEEIIEKAPKESESPFFYQSNTDKSSGKIF